MPQPFLVRAELSQAGVLLWQPLRVKFQSLWIVPFGQQLCVQHLLLHMQPMVVRQLQLGLVWLRLLRLPAQLVVLVLLSPLG